MRFRSRPSARLLTFAAATLLAGTGFGLQPAAAESDLTRTAGANRIATAVAASAEHRDDATDALLASSSAFPDALASTALAATLDAPVLLVDGSLPNAVADELERLGVDTVHLLGGPEAVPDAVEHELEAAGYDVERVAGEDRYETAARLAAAVGPAATGEVVVALGHHSEPHRAWPDAVAAGTLAASPDRLPILLAEPDGLPDATREALLDLDPEQVIVAGGASAVPETVVDAIDDLGFEVDRIAGANRYDTSVELARDALDRSDRDEQPVVFATGEAFPDALAAGALAGSLDAPVVLVPGNRLGDPVDGFLREDTGRWTGGVLVGGSKATSDFVAESLQAALRGEPAPEPPPEPEPEPETSGDGERVVSTFSGVASWYGEPFHGRQTASGETFNMHDLTAAHRSLPFGTRVRVTNQSNGRQVIVRINDRGPFTGGRVIDLSRAAAGEIGMISAGTAQIRGEVLAN